MRILEVAERLGLGISDLDIHGEHRAKVHLDALERGGGRRGRYVLVSAITPTPAGEGKTVTAIGLAMALDRLGRVASVNVRQSSIGPTLGFKGGGAGGGAARIEPLEEALLGMGSDLFAVESAHNLLAALLDDALHRGRFGLDPSRVGWRRVLDVDDRALRTVTVGLGRGNGPARGTGFDITAASEVMGILALSRDLPDLRRRLGAIVVGSDLAGRMVTAEDMRCAGAMGVLLRDAAQPNLLQTSEGTPALVHAGPFGNVGPGVSSVIADRIALPRADYVVTEAGFGSDLGAEKFFHLKCAASREAPDAVVLVATVRALKAHSGLYDIASGRPLPAEIEAEDVAALEAGLPNLRRHVENLRRFGVPVVVAVNRFPTDGTAELKSIREAAIDSGAAAFAEHSAFEAGGEGCIELAEAVEDACRLGRSFRPLFAADAPAAEKTRLLATGVYGAADVAWDDDARATLARLEAAGFGSLPVCMAKTHLSLSHDPALGPTPSGYTFPIRGVRLAAGAGYLLALAGDILTMPGLPAEPRAARLDLDRRGNVLGLE